MRIPNHHCPICNKHLYKRPSELAKGWVYCSKACVGISQRKPRKECPVCGTEIHSRAKTCSRECSNINRTGIKYDKQSSVKFSNRSQRLRHLLIEDRGSACELCGYDNVKILQAHHVIEQSNGGTDELSNLQLLCPNCHYETHYDD